MLRNWLTVALRNLARHRLYTVITVVGLAVGLAAAIVMTVFLRAQTSFDGFFTDADRIYAVGSVVERPGEPTIRTAYTGIAFAPAFAADHPEVEAAVRFDPVDGLVQVGDLRAYESVWVADPAFFQVLDFPFLHGDPATALADPSGVVVTERIARKFFGVADAVGRTLVLNGIHPVQVTAVLKDLEHNTHLWFSVVAPFASPIRPLDRQGGAANWADLCCRTYVKFREGVDADRVLAGAADWMARIAPEIPAEAGGVPVAGSLRPDFRPLRSVHTDPVQGEGGPSKLQLAVAAAIPALILAIATINFANLTTARAMQRAREVALRKVVGASRPLIAIQFLGESVLLALFGLLLAVALAEVALPGFSAFMGDPYAMDYGDPGVLAPILGLTILAGLAGGAHPALIVSGYSPAVVLKGDGGGLAGGGRGRLRTALVVLQFAIAIVLIVATAVVHAQFRFAGSRDPGFVKEDVLVVGHWTSPGVAEHRDAFMQALRQDPAVVGIGLGTFVPGDGDGDPVTVRRQDGGGASQPLEFRIENAGLDYFGTLGMTMLAGRDFDPARAGDRLRWPEADRQGEAAVVVNRTAARRLGFATPDAALGQRIAVLYAPEVTLQATVIGVVEDFLATSLHRPIEPAVYVSHPDMADVMAIRFRPGTAQDGLALAGRTWNALVPDRPFTAGFLETNLLRHYEPDRKMAQLLGFFAGLAIVVACLGLFGLAALAAERRTREIGLRKVLGASVPDIVRLLVWQFGKPVLLANIIAWPIAWLAMTRYLQGFAYRVDLDLLPFLAAGAGALLVAGVTVAGHAARVAGTKPAVALRHA